MKRIAVALSTALFFSAFAAASTQLPQWEGFIRVQNNRFVDANCQDFPVNGFNTWVLMEAAAGVLDIECYNNSMDAVKYTFSTAAKNGMTVVRAFGHGVNSTLPLQTSPGVYNETAFVALDYILETARTYGVKVVFTMGDNWQYADSKMNYNMWAGLDGDSDQFWSNSSIKDMYQAHMKVMANRINTYNGITYKDDETIFAWNLMNEPRCNCFPTTLPYPADFSTLPAGCNPACSDNITTWVGDMSAYLKSVDPNHLVTVGEEGFWGYYDSHMQYNPENSVSPWAALTGNNFTAQHAFQDIDYTAVHYWPDMWTPQATSDLTFFLSWISQHSSISSNMSKPLVLEELGTAVVSNQSLAVLQSSIASSRVPFMEMVYGQFNESLQASDIWRGTLFWMWGFCPQNDQTNDLEIAADDADFEGVIAPSSIAAVQLSVAISPVSSCNKVAVTNATTNQTSSSNATSIPLRPSTSTSSQNITVYHVGPATNGSSTSNSTNVHTAPPPPTPSPAATSSPTATSSPKPSPISTPSSTPSATPSYSSGSSSGSTSFTQEILATAG